VREAARITIGQAVADLKAEFPDVDIKESKIRHLENEGLVEPERTPSGYRKYSVHDMEKLRYIIRAQREHFLPLRVIREHLDALDRGLEPPALSGAPSIPGSLMANPAPGAESLLSHSADVRISRRELIKTAEITEELLEQLENFGLVRSTMTPTP
jgi:DNA-binding transcriptional MerR regulator